MELTPEQKAQVESWSSQRDDLLKNIAILNSEKEESLKKNKELAESNKEIEIKIHQAEGRLMEIENNEEKRKSLVSVEIIGLEKQKNTLEERISSLRDDVKDLILQKNDITVLISFLIETHKEVFSRIGTLDEIVSRVRDVNAENMSDLSGFLGLLKKNIQEIIELNSENVKETKIILEKLPEAILQFRRPVQLIRPILNKRRPEEELKEIDKFKE